MSAHSSQNPSANVEGAIPNPANPNHFMVVQNVEKRIRVYVAKKLIADTNHALRVIEISKHAYEPRFYIPAKNIIAELKQTDTPSTHCPLKGDATYYSVDDAEISWRYSAFDFANILQDHYAFWGPQLRFIEGD